jgi:hypothetical protein
VQIFFQLISIATEHHSIRMQTKLDPHVIRKIAAEAECVAATVSRIHAGLPVRALSAHRVRAALQRLGWMHLFPALATTEIGLAPEHVNPGLHAQPEGE